MRKHVAAMAALLLLQSVQVGAADGPAPADAFMSSLARLCGQAFAGRIAANEPRIDSDPFEGKALVMHVRECRPDAIRLPFHVGEDRSRTWLITRTTNGLRLQHDHRHEDGTPDELTMYGGDMSDQRLSWPRALAACLFCIAANAAPTWAGSEPPLSRTANDADLAWAPCPDVFPAGCQIAVLHGAPAQPNADIFFKVPGRYDIPHHWHRSAERMVLVSGELHVTYDDQATVELKPGMYAYGPAEAPS